MLFRSAGWLASRLGCPVTRKTEDVPGGQGGQIATVRLERASGAVELRRLDAKSAVLSQSGQPIRVSAQGTVPASALGVFDVANPNEEGNNLFAGTATGRGSGVVRGGQLEASGTDPISTMTDMIASLRAYQSGQSAIQPIDQTMQEDASSVGSVQGG